MSRRVVSRLAVFLLIRDDYAGSLAKVKQAMDLVGRRQAGTMRVVGQILEA